MRGQTLSSLYSITDQMQDRTNKTFLKNWLPALQKTPENNQEDQY